MSAIPTAFDPLGALSKKTPLPAPYRALSAISAPNNSSRNFVSTSCYIATELSYSGKNLRAVFDFTTAENTSSAENGVINGAGTVRFLFGVTPTGNVYVQLGLNASTFEFGLGRRAVLELDAFNDTASLNGYTIPVQNLRANFPLENIYLFARNSVADKYCGNMLLHRATFYDASGVIADMLPAEDTSSSAENRFGLYDIVRSRFFVNPLTEPFTPTY